jgi:hypothetical protein
MTQIKLHLANGDSPSFTLKPGHGVDDIRNDIDQSLWLNFGNTRFIRGQQVTWIEVVETDEG